MVLDCFVGCGGNAIQFAMTCHHVIAVDIDPQKLECARHNARIYGVEVGWGVESSTAGITLRTRGQACPSLTRCVHNSKPEL